MTAARSWKSGTNVMVDHDPPYGCEAPRHPRIPRRGASDVQERAGPRARRAERVSTKNARSGAGCDVSPGGLPLHILLLSEMAPGAGPG